MKATRTVVRRSPAVTGLAERLIFGVLGVGLAMVAAYVFLRGLGVLPAGALLPVSIADGPAFGWIERLGYWQRVGATGTSLLVGLVALAAVLGTGRSSRRGAGEAGVHVLDADERGLVLIASEGIETVVRTAVGRTVGVVDCDARVRTRGSRGISLIIDIAVLEDCDVRRTGVGARDRAVEAVERIVGLDVNDVQVRVEVLTPEELGRSVL